MSPQHPAGLQGRRPRHEQRHRGAPARPGLTQAQHLKPRQPSSAPIRLPLACSSAPQSTPGGSATPVQVATPGGNTTADELLRRGPPRLDHPSAAGKAPLAHCITPHLGPIHSKAVEGRQDPRQSTGESW
ncbi:hypothetical protein NDU88_001869 [Pleurodeles waltl]|uniref:Uncharacterized protein n=1 Tax=Pleurodeles waltl TaxID=8319 RepID=A0AAV7U7N2_PLEWA|nr:hypothetical protein NDU88_001869 [Pleurodeles waltl]